MRPFCIQENTSISYKKEHNTPLPPLDITSDILRGCLGSHLFVVVFIKILSDRNEKYLEPDRFDASSHDPPVPSVIFHDPKSTFGLYGTIHSQECPMDTLQVVYNFLMHGGKFPVDPYSTVSIALFTLFRIRASGTVLALVYFLLPPVCVPLYMAAALKMKGLPVRTSHDSVCPDRKVHCPERIFMVLLIGRFLLEHGELHVLFHTILFTEDVIVIGTVSGICDRVLRIKTVCIPELIHKRNKAVHI